MAVLRVDFLESQHLPWKLLRRLGQEEQDLYSFYPPKQPVVSCTGNPGLQAQLPDVSRKMLVTVSRVGLKWDISSVQGQSQSLGSPRHRSSFRVCGGGGGSQVEHLGAMSDSSLSRCSSSPAEIPLSTTGFQVHLTDTASFLQHFLPGLLHWPTLFPPRGQPSTWENCCQKLSGIM